MRTPKSSPSSSHSRNVKGSNRKRKSQTHKSSNRSNKNASKHRQTRRKRTPPPPATATQPRKQSRGHRHQSSASSSLKEVKVSKSSIHTQWKQQLGGIIRYYINNHPSQNEKQAESEVEGMYYGSGCNIQQTKIAILRELGMTTKKKTADHPHDTSVSASTSAFSPSSDSDWVNISIYVEKEGLEKDGLDMSQINQSCRDASLLYGKPSSDNKSGIQLRTEQRVGEGPAHSHESWTNVIIPQWAMNKAYFFEVENKSNLDLSCEIILDGCHQIARNVPLPSKSIRSVKPDNTRYFERHKWLLQPAKRVSLQSQSTTTENTTASSSTTNTASTSSRQRYNGIRPNYHNKRINSIQYPDPTTYGWTFTGSVETSRVEFYEKKLNMGKVLLDFYYTTGTVKTTLDHPTMGRNQLFRNKVSGDYYKKILENPRVHTGKGYRFSMDRVVDGDDTNNDGDGDMVMNGDSNDENVEGINDNTNDDAEMDTSITTTNNDQTNISKNNTIIYYAKNNDYNFKTDGHENRRQEMDKMKNNDSFQAWEEAARKEYAVVHAKFYISLPKRISGGRGGSGRQGRGRGNNRNQQHQREQEPLPEQAPVMDVKASERATLGTKFHSIGPSQQPSRRSNVRMDRIKGLTDDDKFKGDPLFECKLYYRAEDVLQGDLKEEDDDDDDMTDEEEDVMDIESNGDLPKQISLENYKAEKIEQVEQFSTENKIDPEEAQDMLKKCQDKIRQCMNFEDIDELVKIYHDEMVRQQFS